MHRCARSVRSEDNPYLVPESQVADPPAPESEWAAAGKWRRFFNWVLDETMLVALLTLPVIAIYTLDDDGYVAWLDEMPWWQDRLVGMLFAVLYYTALEGAAGVTVGKLLTGTRVVGEDGRRIGFRQALLRSLSRLVPFEMFSVLLADDGDARGWHDRWPRTRVVLKRRPADTPAS